VYRAAVHREKCVEQARILVVSDDREFVDSIVQSWQGLRYSPEFTVAGTDAAGKFVRSAVVLTDGTAALPHLAAGVVLAIAITGGPLELGGYGPGDGLATGTPQQRGLQSVTPRPPVADAGEALPEVGGGLRVVRIQRGAGWADYAAALAQETILRLEAQAQVAEVKQRLREAQRFAALGRFIVEARHGLGNALTGVMGHTELLLLETGAGLRTEVRAQLETIHAMSLKMHETFHRLSSLEMELQMAERQADREIERRPVQ
jgi:signal transduction histidine kinase